MPCEQRQKLIFGHPDRQALTESKKYLFLGAKVLRIDPFSGIRWLIKLGTAIAKTMDEKTTK